MRGEETPCAFYLGGRRLSVVAISQRWQDATHQYFEVTVDDGRRFVLSFEPGLRSWELAAVFAAEMRKPKPKPAAQPAPRKFFFHFRKQPVAKVP
jgi:hypothetical protein